MTPTIYLAGAIRDGVHEDIEWREQMIEALSDQATILNPLGGKTYNSTTREWDMSGIVPDGGVIVPHDFWCVQRADIVVFNFLSLADGYPTIGTLVEFGHATARAPRVLLYGIVPPQYSGHGNSALFRLHPFLAQNCAAVFPTVEACMRFLFLHLQVLSGRASRFGGYTT